MTTENTSAMRIEPLKLKLDGVTGFPNKAAPGCPNCKGLQEEINLFRAIIRRSHPAPQDSDAVAAILLAE